MAPIDQKYSVIEFESLGTKVKNVRRFMVINPTNQGYEFEWTQQEEKGKNAQQFPFKCLTPKGVNIKRKEV